MRNTKSSTYLSTCKLCLSPTLYGLLFKPLGGFIGVEAWAKLTVCLPRPVRVANSRSSNKVPLVIPNRALTLSTLIAIKTALVTRCSPHR